MPKTRFQNSPDLELALSIVKEWRIGDVISNQEIYEWQEKVYPSLTEGGQHVINLFRNMWEVPEIRAKSYYMLVGRINRGGNSYPFERDFGQKIIIIGAGIVESKQILDYNEYLLKYRPKKVENAATRIYGMIRQNGLMTPELDRLSSEVVRTMSALHTQCEVEYVRLEQERLDKKH